MISNVPDQYVTTRLAMHAVAEHVLAPARYASDGHIGLRATPGGFGTPVFGDDVQLRVDKTELVVRRAGSESRAALTTIGEAAAFIRIEPGAPTNVYKPSTALDIDAQLSIDSASAEFLAEWFAFGWHSLEQIRSQGKPDASEVQIWPEHFDAAFEQGDEASGERAGFGASPGDEANPEPYFYVVPWAEVADNPYWNATSFRGAVLSYAQLVATGNPSKTAEEFLREGAEIVCK